VKWPVRRAERRVVEAEHGRDLGVDQPGQGRRPLGEREVLQQFPPAAELGLRRGRGVGPRPRAAPGTSTGNVGTQRPVE